MRTGYILEGHDLCTGSGRHWSLACTMLVWALVAIGCGVSNDKHAGTIEPVMKVGGLVIDDFKMLAQSATPCTFNTHIWPGDNVTGQIGDQDAGVACQPNARVNRLGQCPKLFADCSAGDSTQCDNSRFPYYGSICAQYVDWGDDSVPFIRLAFDVSQIGVPASDPNAQSDAFACFFENLTSDAPLNTQALGLSHVSLWVRPWQSNTNLEISIVDSLSVETGPKKSLLDFNSGSFPKPGDWTPVNVPITELVPSTSVKSDQVNLMSLTQLGFCFANQHLKEIAGNTAMSGVIDINNVAFEP